MSEVTYEQSLEKLDLTLRSLEEGDLSLEDALKAVEQARGHLRACQQKLEEAKRRIDVRPESPAAPVQQMEEDRLL